MMCFHAMWLKNKDSSWNTTAVVQKETVAQIAAPPLLSEEHEHFPAGLNEISVPL